MPQNAGINSAHDGICRHFISSLNPDDPSVTWINAGALDFLSRLESDGRLFELRAFTSTTATDLNDIQRSLFKDCVKKSLTMAGRFEHEKRACEVLRQLARTLPLLLLYRSKQLLAPHRHWLSMASMRCTSRRCGSAQQSCNFFHVAIHELHSIWGRIGWGIPLDAHKSLSF